MAIGTVKATGAEFPTAVGRGSSRTHDAAIRLLGVASVAAFAAWLFVTMPIELLAESLMPPALALNGGAVVPAEERTQAVNLFRRSRGELRCRADLLRAGGTLLLASASAAQSEAERGALTAEAESAFRDSLACAPAQGNLWLVLARIRADQLRFDDEFFAMVAKSHALAPREAWIMGRRSALLANTPAELQPAFRTMLASDLVGLLTSPGWRTVVDVYLASAPPGRLRIIEAIDGAPADLRSRFHLHVLRGG